jgi:serine/threonine protein kinase
MEFIGNAFYELDFFFFFSPPFRLFPDKAIDLEKGETVALKRVKMEKVTDMEGFPMTVMREIQILQRLKHDNIVNLKEVVVGKSRDRLASTQTGNLTQIFRAYSLSSRLISIEICFRKNFVMLFLSLMKSGFPVPIFYWVICLNI